MTEEQKDPQYPDFDPAIVQDFFEHHYKDRGMLKWQGYYLSDHTSALNKQAKEEEERLSIRPKPVMTPQEISAVLEKSYADHYEISMQMYSTSSDRTLEPDITGFVQGYDQSIIVLDTGRRLDLLDIRHANLNK